MPGREAVLLSSFCLRSIFPSLSAPEADSFAVKMGRGPALGSGLLQIHEAPGAPA